ncbi:MAG: nicotinate-nucleotide adenylyltransferase [Fimbriimonadaceae bacterium]
MRSGILGGSFDPPHAGHIALAQTAKIELSLDEVLLVPASRNPHKEAAPRASGRDRLRMCSLAVEDEPGLAVCDIEVVRGGYSYTVDTLEDLQEVRSADYWCILGADAVEGFMTWKEPHRILRLARLAVAAREGQDVVALVAEWDPADRARVDTICLPGIPVSSSKVRDQLLRPVPGTIPVPAKVLDYIRERGLYQ